MLLAAFLALLVINYAASSSALHASSRFQIPYRPNFVRQVQAGNVADISSQGEKIQGDLRHAITYQGRSGTQFATFVPAFANSDRLSALLAAGNVVVNAKPVSSGPSTWVSVLVGFGPRCCLWW